MRPISPVFRSIKRLYIGPSITATVFGIKKNVKQSFIGEVAKENL